MSQEPPHQQDPFWEEERAPSDPFADGTDSLDEGKPKVAGAPKNALVLVAAGVCLIGFVLYMLLGGEDKAELKREVPIEATNNTIPNIPPPLPEPLPPAQEIQVDAAVLPPPPPPSIGGSGNNVIPPPPTPPVITEDPAASEAKQERLRSSMLVINNAAAPGAPSGDDAEAGGSEDGKYAFAERSYAATTAPTVHAGRIERPELTIGQGNLVHAVLETPIDTLSCGSTEYPILRAIVTRDSYAEQGNAVLIPKGSRVVGTCSIALLRGDSRVMVVWQRVIRPDNIDIAINSIAADQLGRAGIKGYVNDRFGEIFSSAVLTSVVAVGVAAVGDELSGNKEVGNNSGGGGGDGVTVNSGETQSRNATQEAAIESSARIGDTLGTVAEQFTSMQQQITVDQGTPITIFVQRDLVFPKSVLRQGQFVR